MKMPFGKFKGRQVEDLPEWYLEWLWANVELFGELESEVEDMLFQKSERQCPKKPDAMVKILPVLQPIYRKHALKHHPDHGGSTAVMQALNGFYDEIKAALKDLSH